MFNTNKRKFVSILIVIAILFWIATSLFATNTLSTETNGISVSKISDLSFWFNIVDYLDNGSWNNRTDTWTGSAAINKAVATDNSTLADCLSWNWHPNPSTDPICAKVWYKFVSSVNSIVNFVLIILFIWAFFKFVGKLFGWEGGGGGGGMWMGMWYGWGGGWDSQFSFWAIIKKAGWELMVIMILFGIWFWVFSDIKHVVNYVISAVWNSIDLQNNGTIWG